MFTTATQRILMALIGFWSIPLQPAHLAEVGALLKHIGRLVPRPER